MESPFMTVREVARYLRISLNEVYRISRQGHLPSRRHGTRKGIVFLADDVKAYSDSKVQCVKKASLSKFEAAKLAARSLKTGNTAAAT